MGWTKLGHDEYLTSAERGLRALNAQGKVTDAELAEDLARLRRERTQGDDERTSTWTVGGR